MSFYIYCTIVICECTLFIGMTIIGMVFYMVLVFWHEVLYCEVTKIGKKGVFFSFWRNLSRRQRGFRPFEQANSRMNTHVRIDGNPYPLC